MPNKKLLIVLSATLVVALQGCVVEPVSPYQRHVEYVQPTYPAPGPGWQWQRHEEHGWGWHHEEQGWHQGWEDARERQREHDREQDHDHERDHDRGRW